MSHPPTPPPVAHRLLAALPQVYQDAGDGDDLRQLLAAFEAVLLGSPGTPDATGLEQAIAALPGLLDLDAPAAAEPRLAPELRDAAARWIAARWVGFTPFAHFAPARLRRIAGGIVPLYARRGTPAYLLALLRLCFDEIVNVALHEHLAGGLHVGTAQVGRTTQLGALRPHTFALEIDLHPRVAADGPPALDALHAAIAAVVDFAKPAHTACDLRSRVLTETPPHPGP